ncbi:warA [Symbiodinium sp. CCMP2456]|nr:warA [Symbiodinium sp. CCMP2456]
MAEDGDAASSQLLRVWTASGKELVALPVEEIATAKALKRRLQSLCGLPRFQQRLLHEGTDLDDDFRFAGSLDLQLVLLNLSDSGLDCVALHRCCYEGSAAEAERILKIPQDPNCQVPEAQKTLIRKPDTSCTPCTPPSIPNPRPPKPSKPKAFKIQSPRNPKPPKPSKPSKP